MKIVYIFLMSSSFLVGMSQEIQKCKILSGSKSELISRSISYDDDDEMMHVTFVGDMSLFVPYYTDPSKKPIIDNKPEKEEETDLPMKTEYTQSSSPVEQSHVQQSKRGLSARLANVSKDNIKERETSWDNDQSAQFDHGASVAISTHESTHYSITVYPRRTVQAINKFKSLLNSWPDPKVGGYVAVLAGEQFKKYGKVVKEVVTGIYEVNIGSRFNKTAVTIDAFQLFPINITPERVTYVENHLGEFLSNDDIQKLPLFARPHIFNPDNECKSEAKSEMIARLSGKVVVEKPTRTGIEVLVALDKNTVIPGWVRDIKEQSNSLEKDLSIPEYSGNVFTICYENQKGEAEFIDRTIYTIRMPCDLYED